MSAGEPSEAEQGPSKMSWTAIQFIHRPTWGPLKGATAALFVIVLIGLGSTGWVDLEQRVEASGQIGADPGVLNVLAGAGGLMSAPVVPAGAHVEKGQVVAMIQLDLPEDRLEAIAKGLERNVELLDRANRRTGLSERIETGRELFAVEDDTIRAAATELDGVLAQFRKGLSTQRPVEDYKIDAIRDSRHLRSRLAGYIERHRLRAPGSGTVLQYEYGADSNVEKGAAVASILPDGARLAAVLTVEPRDMGNVAIGQTVRHEVEAYPFQIYGFFRGEIFKIEQQVLADGRLVYQVHCTILNPHPISDRLASTIRLVRGMRLRSKIVTGDKSLYDALLDAFLGRR